MQDGAALDRQSRWPQSWSRIRSRKVHYSIGLHISRNGHGCHYANIFMFIHHIEPLAEDEDGGENFDMNDATAISVSMPSDDDESQEEEDGDDVSVPSNPSKAARGRKKLKAGAGIHLSPSKTKGEDGDDGDIESVELPSSVVESN
ncbi:hypothetical protein E2562_014985 [Oryza meyeriana var. granulata]|uniref:Uncharacterized protein n=1 Tax=Oryza meyeriana var. granulata TaxID=110450 RepID=A0A6G1EJI1_9ORYZ|nr:hypothetical protein E2562_014985 [Oryza meyeriana var. granulata]